MELTVPTKLLQRYPRARSLTKKSFSALVYGERSLISCCKAADVSERYIQVFAELIRQNVFAVQQLNEINSHPPIFFVVMPQNFSKLTDVDIPNELIIKILLGMLEALCQLEKYKFPHGAIKIGNIFINSAAQVLLGPPRPFLDADIEESPAEDIVEGFSVLSDAQNAGNVIEWMISGKLAFENSMVNRASEMLCQGVPPGLVLEHISKRDVRPLESPEYERIQQIEPLNRPESVAQSPNRSKWQHLRVMPDDPFLPVIDRLRAEADELTCRYRKLALDTCNNRIIRTLHHYKESFPNEIRMEEEEISVSEDSCDPKQVTPPLAQGPSVCVRKVSVFTTQPTEIDFAAQWGAFTAKAGKYRLGTTDGATIDLSKLNIELEMRPAEVYDNEAPEEPQELLIIMCCRGEKSKQFYSFTTLYTVGERWVLSHCKTASLLIRID